MEINELEQIALLGVQAREREAVTRIQHEQAIVIQSIEKRLGLPTGSLGKTHAIDLVAMRVVETSGRSVPVHTEKSLEDK
jgi:hypothetical protein